MVSSWITSFLQQHIIFFYGPRSSISKSSKLKSAKSAKPAFGSISTFGLNESIYSLKCLYDRHALICSKGTPGLKLYSLHLHSLACIACAASGSIKYFLYHSHESSCSWAQQHTLKS